jgi:hypothetical protein
VVVDDVKDLLSLLIEAQSSDRVDQFFGGDVATVIVVKDVKALLNLDNITF